MVPRSFGVLKYARIKKRVVPKSFSNLIYARIIDEVLLDQEDLCVYEITEQVWNHKRKNRRAYMSLLS